MGWNLKDQRSRAETIIDFLPLWILRIKILRSCLHPVLSFPAKSVPHCHFLSPLCRNLQHLWLTSGYLLWSPGKFTGQNTNKIPLFLCPVHTHFKHFHHFYKVIQVLYLVFQPGNSVFLLLHCITAIFYWDFYVASWIFHSQHHYILSFFQLLYILLNYDFISWIIFCILFNSLSTLMSSLGCLNMFTVFF